MSPEDPPTESLYLIERIKKAIASYDHEEVARLNSEGIALYPRNPSYHVTRAAANVFLLNYQGAITDAANALLLDPGHRLLQGLPYLHMGRALIGLGDFDHAFTIANEGLKVDSADVRLTRCLELARVAGTSKRASLWCSTGTDNTRDVFEGGEVWLKLDGDMVASEYRHDLEFQRKVSEARRNILKLGEHLREDKRFLKAFEILLNVKFMKNVGGAAPEAEIEGTAVTLLEKLDCGMIFAIVEYQPPELMKLCELLSQVDVDAEKTAKDQEEEGEEVELAKELLRMAMGEAYMVEEETEDK